MPLSRSVIGEAHFLKGAVRFRELVGGVLYAQISPKAQVLTCLGSSYSQYNVFIHASMMHTLYCLWLN